MSTLQISLAIAGAAVLVVVVAHGAWTSRKNRPRQATQPTQPTSTSGEMTADASPESDSLERQEPASDLVGRIGW